MPLTAYQIRITNPTSGAQIDLVDGRRILSLRYERLVNEPGSFELTMLASDVLCSSAATLDLIYDIYRDNGTGSFTYEHSFTGRYYEIFEDNNREYMIIAGKDLLDLFLKYRVIRPEDDPAGANGYSTKSGVADTVMYEFVDEQCISPATNALRAFPGLTNNTDLNIGTPVTARKGDESTLLEVLKELADSGGVDFYITHSGSAAFVFSVRAQGSDRTRASNFPGGTWIVFKPERRNVANPRLTIDRRDEYTVAITQAQGQRGNRPEFTLQSPARFDSPFNYRERIENARNVEDDASVITNLTTAAAAALEQRAGVQELVFEMNPYGPQAKYNVDWVLGDRVTGVYKTVEQEFRITGVEIEIDDGGETITPTLTRVTNL